MAFGVGICSLLCFQYFHNLGRNYLLMGCLGGAECRNEQQVGTQRPGSTTNIAAECFPLRNSPIAALLQTEDALYPLNRTGGFHEETSIDRPSFQKQTKNLLPNGNNPLVLSYTTQSSVLLVIILSNKTTHRIKPLQAVRNAPLGFSCSIPLAPIIPGAPHVAPCSSPTSLLLMHWLLTAWIKDSRECVLAAK